MKTIIGIVLMCFIGINLYAQNLTAEQTKLQKDILQFLKEEGYLPEIDKDGDIKFKKEGDNFYIVIDKRDHGPFFVKLFEVLNYSENYSRELVKLAISELNFYKGVKVLCYDQVCYIQAEMYVHNSENFKYVFYKLIGQLASVEDKLIDECKKVSLPAGNGNPALLTSKIPFVITNFEVANSDYEGNIITDFGSTIYSYNTKYLQPRITVTPLRGNGTYTVYVRLYQDNSLRTGTSSPTDYSYSTSLTVDETSGQKFSLSGWGANTAVRWAKGKYRFEVWYDNYCLGSKTFDIK